MAYIVLGISKDMKTFKLIVLVCAFFLMASDSVFAATVYVSKAGKDTNNGSQTSPFLTFIKAVSVLAPGDRLLIGEGVYTEDLNLITQTATEQNPITVEGQGDVTIKRVLVKGPSHRIQNLTVSGQTSGFSSLLWLRRGAHNTIVSNVWVKGALSLNVEGISWETPTTRPIGTDAASNCLIISNKVTGIAAATALSMLGRNNRVIGNYFADIGQADFVRLWGLSNVIQNNIFTNSFPLPGVGYHPDFIQTFGNNQFGSQAQLIDGNIIAKIQGGQICQMEGNLVPEIRDWTFSNNIFAYIDLGASCSVAETKWYNNVFYRCNPNGSSSVNIGPRTYTLENNWKAGVNIPNGARVMNNAFIECGRITSTEAGWYFVDTNLVDVVADYNYVVGADGASKRVNPLQQSVGDTGGWNIFRWWEDHGVNGGLAGYASEENLDFRVGPTSILVGRALSLLAVGKDIFGQTRTVSPTIGPYEVKSLKPLPPQRLTVVP